jgi:hypothetical protein
MLNQQPLRLLRHLQWILVQFWSEHFTVDIATP